MSEAKGFLGRRIYTETGLAYEWATMAGFHCYSADASYFGADEVVVHGDPSNGYVYRQETGNSRDGENITAIYITPDIVFENAEIRKVMHWMKLYTFIEGSMNLSLQLLFDFRDSNTLQPNIIPINTEGRGSRYGEAVYGSSTYSLSSFATLRQNLTGSGAVCSFKFTSSDTSEPYRIDSFQVVFSPKGRR